MDLLPVGPQWTAGPIIELPRGECYSVEPVVLTGADRPRRPSSHVGGVSSAERAASKVICLNRRSQLERGHRPQRNVYYQTARLL
jgi:hypothetical protein